jgi:hypothetical protein
MHAEEAPYPHTDLPGPGVDDPSYNELQDTLQAFVLLTLDCMALTRAMREAAPPSSEDQLERLRRRRLARQLEAALADPSIRPTGGVGDAG